VVVADRAFAPSVPALSALAQALARLGHIAILRFVRLDGSVRAPLAMRACAGCACEQAPVAAFRIGLCGWPLHCWQALYTWGKKCFVVYTACRVTQRHSDMQQQIPFGAERVCYPYDALPVSCY